MTRRMLLPLSLLLAGPVLGWGAGARGDYETPALLIADPGMMSASSAGVDAAIAAPVAEEDSRPDDPAFLPQLLETMFARSTAATSSGDSSQPGPDGPHNSSSSSTMNRTPRLDSPVTIGVLFLQAVRVQPPPFPARLFRPPRCA